MTENTGGTPAAEQAGTGTPTEQQVTTPPSETGGRDAEGRIAGLVAERERLKTQLEAEKKAREAIEEEHKTEDQKRLDQMVKERVESEYGPVRQRLERIEAELTAKRDKLLESLPEDSRSCYDESAPVEVQVRQIELVAAHLSTQGTPPSVSSGGNPPAQAPKDTRKYTKDEYDAVQRLAVTDPDKFDELWPEMKRALVENRVEGVSPGRVAMR